MPSGFNVDDLLGRIYSAGAGRSRLTNLVTEKDLVMCCSAVKAVFAGQPSLLEISPPVIVVGDIRGRLDDLLRIFDRQGFPPDSNYLFLGNYVDNASKNIEAIILMFCYKIKFPENFFMLRGSHETSINRVYGFYEECCRRYGTVGKRLWMVFNDTFNWMPLTALIGGRILCMNGGLSPLLESLDQLRNLPRPQVNNRGCSYLFGSDVVLRKCNALGIDMIVRSHQVDQEMHCTFEQFEHINETRTAMISIAKKGMFD